MAWLYGLHRSANAIVYGGKTAQLRLMEKGGGVECSVGLTLPRRVSAGLVVKLGSAIRSAAE